MKNDKYDETGSTSSFYIIAAENHEKHITGNNLNKYKFKKTLEEIMPSMYNLTLQNEIETFRQQENKDSKEPEVMRFKASQKVYDPNESDKQKSSLITPKLEIDDMDSHTSGQPTTPETFGYPESKEKNVTPGYFIRSAPNGTRSLLGNGTEHLNRKRREKTANDEIKHQPSSTKRPTRWSDNNIKKEFDFDNEILRPTIRDFLENLTAPPLDANTTTGYHSNRRENHHSVSSSKKEIPSLLDMPEVEWPGSISIFGPSNHYDSRIVDVNDLHFQSLVKKQIEMSKSNGEGMPSFPDLNYQRNFSESSYFENPPLPVPPPLPQSSKPRSYSTPAYTPISDDETEVPTTDDGEKSPRSPEYKTSRMRSPKCAPDDPYHAYDGASTYYSEDAGFQQQPTNSFYDDEIFHSVDEQTDGFSFETPKSTKFGVSIPFGYRNYDENQKSQNRDEFVLSDNRSYLHSSPNNFFGKSTPVPYQHERRGSSPHPYKRGGRFSNGLLPYHFREDRSITGTYQRRDDRDGRNEFHRNEDRSQFTYQRSGRGRKSRGGRGTFRHGGDRDGRDEFRQDRSRRDRYSEDNRRR